MGAFSSTSPNPLSSKNFLAAAGEDLSSALFFFSALITILYAEVVTLQNVIIKKINGSKKISPNIKPQQLKISLLRLGRSP
jgi:hypothetical protein